MTDITENSTVENSAENTEQSATSEISLDNLKAGKLDFKTLPYQEKVRLSKEAYDKLTDDRQKEAWDLGWRSKEFYIGKHRDGTDKPFSSHEEFLKKIDEVAPAKNERLRHISQEKTVLEKKLEESLAENRKMMELFKMREERTLTSEESRIEREIQEAEDLGDVKKYAAAQSEKAQIQSNKLKLKDFDPQPSTQPRTNPVAPETIEWAARNNSWFQRDQTMTEYAMGQEQILQKTHPDSTLSERLDMIEKSVKTVFNDRFPTKTTASAVDSSKSSGTLTSQRKTETKFGDLPETERWQARQMIKRGIFKDETDFMTGYNKVNKK